MHAVIIHVFETGKWCFSTDHCQGIEGATPISRHTTNTRTDFNIRATVLEYGADNLVTNPDPNFEPDYAYQVFEKLGMM